MAVENPWALDWETTPEAVDQEASSWSSKLDEGPYRVKVVKTEFDNTNGNQKFTFEVIHGPCTGRRHFEVVDNPGFGDKKSDAKRKAEAGIARTWASRLGCIPPGTTGKVAPEWNKSLGKEMVIRITVRKWETQDKKIGEAHEIGWSNLWPLDHKDLNTWKNDDRAACGLPPIPGNDRKADDVKKPANGNGAAAGQPAGTVPATAKQTVDQMANDIFN